MPVYSCPIHGEILIMGTEIPNCPSCSRPLTIEPDEGEIDLDDDELDEESLDDAEFLDSITTLCRQYILDQRRKRKIG